MNILKATNLFAIACLISFSSGLCFAEKKIDHKANYEKKVKVNNDTIGIIAGVINYVCPKLVASSTKICNPKDPVTSAVKFQEQFLGGKGKTIDDLDDLDEAQVKKAMKARKILHQEAAFQFYDAVERFKDHMPLREKAKKLAKEKKWEDASRHEEMAWQYLVKCASRGIFTKKMVDGE